MGSRAADNIHQQILFEQSRVPLDLTEWPEVPPMIAMAIGTKAAVYDPVGGVKCSEEMMKIFFGGDLGFDRKFVFMMLSWYAANMWRMLPLPQIRGRVVRTPSHLFWIKLFMSAVVGIASDTLAIP